MSGTNGEKARFNRKRRQKIHRRARQHALLQTLFKPADAPPQAAKPNQKERLA